MALKYGVKRPIKWIMYGCPLWALILILIGCIVYAAAAPRASFATFGFDTNTQSQNHTIAHCFFLI